MGYQPMQQLRILQLQRSESYSASMYYLVEGVLDFPLSWCHIPGIGIAVTLVTAIAQGRVQRMQERLMSKTAGKAKALANETKATIKDKVEGIEKLTEEDFDGLVIMMKSLRLTLLEESKIVYKCPRCGSDYRSKPKFCSDCGFALT